MALVLSEVRDALKVRLGTIPGLRAHDTIPDTVNPPCAVVEPVAPFDYHASMGPGLSTFRFNVHVLASRTNARTGQDTLDRFCDSHSPTSVRAAIEGDRTLGGACSDVQVTALSDYGTADVAGVTYYAAQFQIEVHG